MSNQIRNLSLFMSLLLFFSINTYSQDVIIKNDRTEIKSKVSEISETTIKYKKWENLDGPLYNISKSEVFMIIYANGKRETMKQTPSTESGTPQNQSNVLNSGSTKGNNLENQIKQTSTVAGIDTTIDYKSIKIKYKPSRVNIGLQSPITIGTDQEFRILKNTLNIGIAYYYTFPKNDYILQSNFGFIYASLYAPINRLTGNYENQDKGLFLFGQLGYSLTSTQYIDIDANTYSASSGRVTWRFGADYYISKGFGITLSAYEFKTFYGGVVFSIL